MGRGRTSEEDARNRIKRPDAIGDKKGQADILIDNTGSLDDSNEQFWKVLFQVTRPLTWTEFWLLRQGTFSALASVIVGVLIC